MVSSKAAWEKIENFFNGFKSLSYRRRETILGSDETADKTFYIKEGFVRVYRLSAAGEELTVAILKPRDLFPLSLEPSEDEEHIYYLEAITDVVLWAIPREQFLKFIKKDPEVLYELTTSLVTKYNGLLSRMENLVFGNAYTKVASTLLSCAKNFGQQQGTDVILNLPLSHREIATLVGITRETACLEIKKLEKKGLVCKLGRWLVVKDLVRLEEESVVENKESPLLFH